MYKKDLLSTTSITDVGRRYGGRFPIKNKIGDLYQKPVYVDVTSDGFPMINFNRSLVQFGPRLENGITIKIDLTN